VFGELVLSSSEVNNLSNDNISTDVFAATGYGAIAFQAPLAYTFATQKTTNNAESVVIKADCTGTLKVKPGSDYAIVGKQITWMWNSKSGKPPGLIDYADIFENTGASACSTIISYMESYYVPGTEPAFSAV
jgi:hypothetical protein